MSWQYDLQACGIVTGSHTAATTSINVGTGEGSRFAVSPRKLVIFEASYYDNPADAVAMGKGEVVIQTLQASDVLTVQRGQDGTTALDMTDVNLTWFVCNFVDVMMGGELANVKAFGAVGDGVADDTDAVHLAILSAGNGGSVFFPAGVYSLATWPDAGRDYGQITLLGEGTNSTVDGPATALFVDVSEETYAHGLNFTDWLKVFELDPINSTIDAFCIEFCRFSNVDRPIGWTVPLAAGLIKNCTILNCTFVDLTDLAVFLKGVWNHLIVDGCRFDTSVDGCIKLGNDTAADDADWRNTRVTNNSIKDVTTATASVRAIDVFGKDVVVTGNSIENVSGGTTDTIGIHCECERAVISGNIILNVDGSAGVRGMGIRIHGNDLPGGSSSSPDGFNVVIDGNVIDMADKDDSRGIGIENDNVICSNNVIVGVREIGITTGSSGTRTYSNLTIQGNRIAFATLGTPGYGIYFQAAGDGYHVRGNTITGSLTGVIFQPTSGTPSDYTVVGNSIAATTAGIRVQTSVVVTGIQFSCNHITGATTGLSMETTSCDLVLIALNTFSGVTTDFALSALPTNLNWLEQNGDTLEIHGKVDIILGGLTVTAGGLNVTGGAFIHTGGLDVISGTTTLEGGNVIHNASGAPASGLGSIGDVYLRTDGGAGTSFYVKEGASTWAAK